MPFTARPLIEALTPEELLKLEAHELLLEVFTVYVIIVQF